MSDFQAFLLGPALEPPAGVTPDFHTPESLARANVFAATWCALCAIFLVALRLYNNIVLHRQTRADDWILVLGLASYIAYCATAAVLVENGIMRHQWNIRMIEWQSILYWYRISSCLYGVCVTLVKSSICLQYIYIFNPGERDFMFYSCSGLIVFLAGFYGSLLFAEIFACNPVSKFWTPWMEGGHCMNYLAMNVAAGTVNTISDIVLIVLPQKSIWRLGITKELKWKVSTIFLVAFVALMASVVRLYYAVEAMTSIDKSSSILMMGRWTFVEFFTTFLCSCMPALTNLVRHWMRKRGALSYRSSGTDFVSHTGTRSNTIRSGGAEIKSQPSVQEHSIADTDASRSPSRYSAQKTAEIGLAC